MWKDLTMKQRSEVMAMAIRQGITDLDEIKNFYDSSLQTDESSLYKESLYSYGGPLGNMYGGRGSRSQKLKKKQPYQPRNFSSAEEMIKAHEGFRSTPYKDGKNKKTGEQWYSIGYGFNDSGIHPGLASSYIGRQMSRAEADRLFVDYMGALEKQLKQALGTKLYNSLTPGQRMAYLDTGYQRPAAMLDAARIHRSTGDMDKVARSLAVNGHPERNADRYYAFTNASYSAPTVPTTSMPTEVSTPSVAPTTAPTTSVVQQTQPFDVSNGYTLGYTGYGTEDSPVELDEVVITAPKLTKPQQEYEDAETQKAVDFMNFLQSSPAIPARGNSVTPEVILPDYSSSLNLFTRPTAYMPSSPMVDSILQGVRPANFAAYGGNLFDEGGNTSPYIRNYQWRTMPETQRKYTDYDTGKPIQPGDKVWTNEQGQLVTADMPWSKEDWAVAHDRFAGSYELPELGVVLNKNTGERSDYIGEQFEDYQQRMANAPIVSNTDLDKELSWAYDQYQDFKRQQYYNHLLNEEFNRQVDNFFGFNWLRPSQIVGAFRDDPNTDFGERLLLGTNNYGIWNPNHEFIKEHPYLAEGANILFDFALPEAAIGNMQLLNVGFRAARYNPYMLSRAMNARLKHASVESPVLTSNYRYKWGDLELNDPNLMYHHDYGNGAINYTNSTGANIINGEIIPGKSFREGQKGYVWWNKGRPFGIGLSPDGNTAGFTRMVTTHADNPNLLQVRSVDYPIGQWNGKSGFVRTSEYVSSTPVKVNDNSIYTFIPGRGFLRGNLNQIYDRALTHGDSYLQQKVRDLNFSKKSGTKLVNDDGNPQNLWHGSPNYFTEYDPLKFGTVTDDGYYGKGLYTSQDYNTAAPYGRDGYMYNFYVNSKNPFKVGFYDNAFNPFSREELEVRSGIAPDFNKDTKHILTGYDEGLVNKLRTELANSDAVIMSYPKGSAGFKYDEVVIPTPEQLKLVDAVTFDDYGLIIPLSERDNFSVKDFRYSMGGEIKTRRKK